MPKNDATLRIGADVSGASKAINKLNRDLAAVKLDSLINLGEKALRGGKALLGVASNLETLRTRLQSVTPSITASEEAFKNLNKFSETVPLSVNEVVDSFIKLKSLGLEPSERALMSYTNTSSAMGKSLNQLVEAVADASVGEMERLKEFGIKAKKQGDEIEFTFQGVTTTVKNNSDEIQEYLMAIGENQFAGAAARQMETMEGTITNLENATSNLFDSIVNETGVGAWFKQRVNDATNFLNKINQSITSFENLSLKEQVAQEKSRIAELSKELDMLYANMDPESAVFDQPKIDRINARIQQITDQAKKARIELQTIGEQSAVADSQAQDAKEIAANNTKYEAFSKAHMEWVDLRKQTNLELQEMTLSALDKDLQAHFNAGTEKLNRIKQMEAAGLLTKKQAMEAEKQVAISGAMDVFGALASQNKKIFAMYQAYATGKAIMATFGSAASALEYYGPTPIGFLAAASAVVKGLAYVSMIRAQSFQGRQYGGTVTGNTPYLVGEKGPEIVVPGRTGTVVPNNQLGGAKNVNITFNVSTVDSTGFNDLLQTSKPMIVGMIQQAVHEQPGLIGA